MPEHHRIVSLESFRKTAHEVTIERDKADAAARAERMALHEAAWKKAQAAIIRELLASFVQLDQAHRKKALARLRKCQ